MLRERHQCKLRERHQTVPGRQVAESERIAQYGVVAAGDQQHLSASQHRGTSLVKDTKPSPADKNLSASLSMGWSLLATSRI